MTPRATRKSSPHVHDYASSVPPSLRKNAEKQGDLDAQLVRDVPPEAPCLSVLGLGGTGVERIHSRRPYDASELDGCASGNDAVEAILRVEVVPHIGHELVVSGMIKRLYADNFRRERVVVLVHVADEIQLRG